MEGQRGGGGGGGGEKGREVNDVETNEMMNVLK